MKNIVFVISTLGSGGAERVLVDVASELVNRNINVTILTIGKIQNDFYGFDKKIKRINLGPYKYFNPLKLRLKILNEKPDCIISFMDKTNVKVLAALSYTKTPVIVTEHSDVKNNDLSKLWRILRYIFYKKSTLLVGVTHPIIDHFSYLKVSKKKVIYNPLPISKEENFIKYGKKNIIWIGRFHEVKNLKLFLDAVKELAAIRSDFQVTILGDGKDSALYKNYVKDLVQQNVVTFYGNVKNPYKYIKNSTMLVSTSKSEGFGNVFIEAMSLGVPVVATKTIGSMEIVNRNNTGVIVDTHTVNELIAAINDLLNDQSSLNEYSINALNAYKQFTIFNIGDQWMRTIEEVTSDGTR